MRNLLTVKPANKIPGPFFVDGLNMQARMAIKNSSLSFTVNKFRDILMECLNDAYKAGEAGKFDEDVLTRVVVNMSDLIELNQKTVDAIYRRDLTPTELVDFGMELVKAIRTTTNCLKFTESMIPNIINHAVGVGRAEVENHILNTFTKYMGQVIASQN